MTMNVKIKESDEQLVKVREGLGKAVVLKEKKMTEVKEKFEEKFLERAKEIFDRGNLSPTKEENEFVTASLQEFWDTPEGRKIAFWLKLIARDLESKEAIISAVKCALKFKDFPEVAYQFVDSLKFIAQYCINGEKLVTNAANWLSSDEVVNCILKFKDAPEVAEIAHRLGWVAYHLGQEASEEAIKSSARKISEAKTPEEAVEIAKKL